MNAEKTDMLPARRALVLGATGGIGGAVARALKARGYRIRALHRDPARQAGKGSFEWVKGDAMAEADVVSAARDCQLIVHAVNPPGYRNWGKLVLPMIDNTIAAARIAGATILMPGTVYNYGPDAWPAPREDSPQHPETVKGGIRVQLEQRLEAAAAQGVRVILVRAGDYFGPGAANNWFAQAFVKPGKPVGAITTPSARGIGHQWAYLPDVAETMVQLVERAEELPHFARFHLDGFWDPDGLQMAAAIRRVTGRPDLKLKRFPWFAVTLLAPFVPLFRELREMRYLWRVPLRMDNTRVEDFLGAEPRTPIDEAVRATLASLDCLPAPSASPKQSHDVDADWLRN